MRIRINDIEESKYFKMPKALYKLKLKPIEREIYMICLNNWRLSMRNNWINENGEVYFYASQEKLANVLNVSKPTIIKSFKVLLDLKLIEVERSRGFANVYYLTKIEEDVNNFEDQNLTPKDDDTDENLDDDPRQNDEGDQGKIYPTTSENLSPVKNLYQSKNFTTTSKETLLPPVKNLYPNKKEYNKNELNKKEYKEKENLIKEKEIKPTEQNNDFLSRILNLFTHEYKQNRGRNFYVTSEEKERSGIATILRAFKQEHPGETAKDYAGYFKELFKNSLEIEDKFIRTSISPSFIASQYNRVLSTIEEEQSENWKQNTMEMIM